MVIAREVEVKPVNKNSSEESAGSLALTRIEVGDRFLVSSVVGISVQMAEK